MKRVRGAGKAHRERAQRRYAAIEREQEQQKVEAPRSSAQRNDATQR